MVHIKITKGLDIPIKGKPAGKVQQLTLSGEASSGKVPRQISLNLDPFEQVRFQLLAKKGERVKIGQPLAEDKQCPGRFFASPAGGIVAEVRRGLKRRLLNIVIEIDSEEQWHEHGALDVKYASPEELTAKLKAGGGFAYIRRRPFNQLADPSTKPRNIFVKAIESAPLVPPPELQIEGKEEEFQIGLTALSKLTEGSVHLVYRKDSPFRPFTEAKDVKKHTAEGPHPIGTHSLHIQEIDPIRKAEDIIWTLNVYDVLYIGHLLRTGRILTERVIGIGGPAILPGRTGYFQIRSGCPIEWLVSNRIEKGYVRLISGDPLMGRKVGTEDFLGFNHFAFTAVPENIHREFLHFFRLGIDKFSFSKAYLSGHFSPEGREYDFTTTLHGEPRAFIDSTLYDKINPLNVSTMHLVKAIMAEDYDSAEELGLLEVDSEDFALATFVCPSKIEMTEIVKEGLKAHASEVLG